ncbi:MAG: hypothetical protein H6562_04215 [Lewinellaceae bacterium]|nr:hypothetical protein [Lewinellaceae bacterium]
MNSGKFPLNNYDQLRQELKVFASSQVFNSFLYLLFTEQNGRRVPVCRVAGEDPEGILYIGQTTKLVDRLSLLCRSFQSRAPSGKRWQHGADEIYWQCVAVRDKYARENMWVEVTPCDDSKAAEHEAIRNYYMKFGEVPPFNGAIVKR